MIGELFNAMIDEVFDGSSPATRRSAILPYLSTKYNAYAHGVGATLSAMASVPMPAPAPALAPAPVFGL